jgi:hypothetical protein
MKLIAFILSAYLLFLFAVPCCSFDNCSEEKTAQTQKHEKSDGDCGTCSPFFTCTGCSGFTIAPSEINRGLVSFSFDKQYAGYIVSSITEVDHDFWQPPKIG